jgi:hypothetical protein
MSKMDFAFMGYFGILLALLLFFPKFRFRKTEKKQEEKQNTNQENNEHRVLKRDTDYIEEFGLINPNKNAITESESFKIILRKIPNLYEQLGDAQLFYDAVMRLRPYSMSELFAIVKYLREEKYDSPESISAYKTHVTASAIVYDFTIPKSLFNDDAAVLLPMVAAHISLHRPVSVFNEVQRYIKDVSNPLTGLEVVEQHKQLARLLEDFDFANVFITTMLCYDEFLSIKNLYDKWLMESSVNAFNLPLYKQDINCFKKLLTMYFGIMEIDAPKEYLYIDVSVCEYVLQIRRYDPSKSFIRVVE